MLFSIVIPALTVISILIILKIYLRVSIGRCISPVCLVGKTALVTGGNSGIGFQTALALAGRGCRVIIADKDNCEKSKERIIKETNNSNIIIKHFDLASLDSVRKLAQDIIENEHRLDILINNAGAGFLGNFYSKDGLHVGMQVNHFGPFLLTHLLVALLKKSAPSRIIFVSSVFAYLGTVSTENLNAPALQLFIYSNSKLCNIMTAKELARKLKGTEVTSNSLHPGIVYTPMYQRFAYTFGNYKWMKILGYFFVMVFLKPFSKNEEEGAQTSIYLAIAKEVENVSGKFFFDCKSFLQPSLASNQSYTKDIWELSEKLVKLSPEEKL